MSDERPLCTWCQKRLESPYVNDIDTLELFCNKECHEARFSGRKRTAKETLSAIMSHGAELEIQDLRAKVSETRIEMGNRFLEIKRLRAVIDKCHDAGIHIYQRAMLPHQARNRQALETECNYIVEQAKLIVAWTEDVK